MARLGHAVLRRQYQESAAWRVQTKLMWWRCRLLEPAAWALRERIVKGLLAEGFDVELCPAPTRVYVIIPDAAPVIIDVEGDGNFYVGDRPSAVVRRLRAVVHAAKLKQGLTGCWVDQHYVETHHAANGWHVKCFRCGQWLSARLVQQEGRSGRRVVQCVDPTGPGQERLWRDVPEGAPDFETEYAAAKRRPA